MATFVVDVIAGTLAGLGATFIGHPFDTLKVRLQTQPSPPNHIYSGIIDCVRKTIQWEGVGGLYKGVSAPLAGQIFFRTALFGTNAAYLRQVNQNGSFLPPSLGGGSAGALRPADYGFGGSCAWGLSAIVECPLNVIASQMQVQIIQQRSNPAYKPEFPTVMSYVQGAPSKYGMRALYAGIAPHLVRNICGGFFHFGAFEFCRREYASSIQRPVTEIGMLANMAAGSVGGVLFWFLTYPFDLVKGAMQGDSLDPKIRRFNTMADAFRKLWAEGGLPRFFKGFDACMLRSIPVNAVMFMVAFRAKEVGYEYMAKNKLD